jgi:hypothetical protein
MVYGARMRYPEPQYTGTSNPQIPHIITAPSVAILLIAGAIVSGCVGTGELRSARGAPIAVQSVHMSGAGHYVDLRYRVLDAQRAQAALGPSVRPRLIDEATGAVMAVPTTAKLGSLRQTQASQTPGRTYFVLFVNSGVREGSRVTAELGELRFEHLRIE